MNLTENTLESVSFSLSLLPREYLLRTAQELSLSSSGSASQLRRRLQKEAKRLAREDFPKLWSLDNFLGEMEQEVLNAVAEDRAWSFFLCTQ